jgi:hypothetical protein
LETPTLVKLRYRGVVPFKAATVPLASSEDDIIAGDMSSLGDGVDTDDELLRLEENDGERRERQPRQHRRQRLRSTDTESKASEPRGRREEQNGGPSPAAAQRRGATQNVARRPAHGVKAPRQLPNKTSVRQPSPNGANPHVEQRRRASAAPESRRDRDDGSSDDEEDRPETQVPVAQIDRTNNGDDDNHSRKTAESDETVDPDADRQVQVRSASLCSLVHFTILRE